MSSVSEGAQIINRRRAEQREESGRNSRALAQSVVGEGKPLPSWIERALRGEGIDNQDGSRSTIESMSIEIEGRQALLFPTIRQQHDGRILRLNPDEATEIALRRGDGIIFPNQASANNFSREFSDSLGGTSEQRDIRDRQRAMGLETPDQLKDKIAFSMRADPDKFAHMQGISDRLQVPIDAVERDLSFFERIDAGRQVLSEIPIDARPVLRKFLSDSETNRRVSSDSLKELADFEFGWNSAKVAYGSGQDMLELAEIFGRRKDGERLSLEDSLREFELTRRLEERHGSPGFFERGFSGASKMLPLIITVGGGAAEQAVESAGTAFVVGLGIGLPPHILAPFMGLGATFGGTFGAFKKMRDFEANLAFGQYIALETPDGDLIDPEAARFMADVVGNINGVVELASLGFAGKALQIGGKGIFRAITGREMTAYGLRMGTAQMLRISPTLQRTMAEAATKPAARGLREFVNFTRAVGRATLFESGEEFLQGTVTDLGRGTLIDDVDVRRSLGRGFEEFVESVPTTFFLGFAGLSISATIEIGAHGARAVKSRVNMRRIDTAVRAGIKAKLRQRDRETWEEFVARVQGSEVEDLFIPAEALVEYFQTKGLIAAEVLAEAPSVRDQIPVALESGKDVVIPLAEYISVLGEEHHEGLRREIRLAGDASIRETEEFVDNADNIVQAIQARVAEEEQELTSLEQVYSEVLGHAVRVGYSGAGARTVSLVWLGRFQERARRQQRDPLELFNETEFQVFGAFEEPPPIRQPKPTLEATLAELREARTQETAQRELRSRLKQLREGLEPELLRLPRQPVLNILKRLGGVDPTGPLASELEAIGVARRGKGSVPGLFRKGGITDLSALDLATEAVFVGLPADEAGRLQVQDILNAIQEELQGRPLRTEEEAARINLAQVARRELSEALEDLEIDIQALTDEQIEAALFEENEQRLLEQAQRAGMQAAVRNDEGVIAVGFNHGEAFANLIDEVGREPTAAVEEGFLNAAGEFLTRQQAAEELGLRVEISPGRFVSVLPGGRQGLLAEDLELEQAAPISEAIRDDGIELTVSEGSRAGDADDARAPEVLGTFVPEGSRAVIPTGAPEVTLVQTGTFRSGITLVDTPEDVAHAVAGLRKEAQESFLVVVTDDAGEILNIIRHTTGTVNESLVLPAIALGPAFATPGAARIWAVHNHPSGFPRQSEDDRTVVTRLNEALLDTGIEFEGSIVVAPGGNATFRKPDGPVDGITFSIPALRRDRELAVMQRRFKTAPRNMQAIQATDPSLLEGVFDQLAEPGQTGVALFNARNTPVAFLPLTAEEMTILRTGDTQSGVGAILSEAARRNATSMAIRFDKEDIAAEEAVQNMVSFGRVVGLRVFDAMDLEGVSATATGRLPAPERTFMQSSAVRIRGRRDVLEKYGLDPSERQSIRQVGAALEAWMRSTSQPVAPGDFSPGAVRTLARWMVEEVRFELLPQNRDNSALGWYSEKYQRGLDTLAIVFPELTDDTKFDLSLPGHRYLENSAGARDFMSALIGITSDGQRPAANFGLAIQVYEEFAKTGTIKPPEFGGARRKAIRGNIAKLMELRESMSLEEMTTWLTQELTVSELNRMARAKGIKISSGFKASTVLPMATVVFGPKIGAFYTNLTGRTDGYLVMDRWFARTINRYRGELQKKVSEPQLQKFKRLLGRPRMSNDEALAFTTPHYLSFKAKGFKRGTEIERTANGIYRAAFLELEDAPANSSDREFMINAVRAAQSTLAREGVDLSMADIQALLWYFEKRLYGELGAPQRDDISYAEAARQAVRGRNRAPGPAVLDPRKVETEGPSGTIVTVDAQTSTVQDPAFDEDIDGQTADALDAFNRRDRTLLQRAFHGAQRRFPGELSMDFVGTGEAGVPGGGGAFGFGLYFAQRRGIAEFYRAQSGTGLTIKFKGKPVQRNKASIIQFTQIGERMVFVTGQPTVEEGQLEVARANIAVLLGEQLGTGNTFEEAVQRSEDLLQSVLTDVIEGGDRIQIDWAEIRLSVLRQVNESDIEVRRTGVTLEVEIPEDNELMLWDEVLSNQPRTAELALRELIEREDLGPGILTLVSDDNTPRAFILHQPGIGILEHLGEFDTRADAQAAIDELRLVEDMTAADIYEALTINTSDELASEALNELGVKGHKYLDQGSRGPDVAERSFNFVIWEDQAVEIVRRHYQESKGGPPRGSITFGPELRKVVIRMFKAQDLSTFLHESGHLFLEQLRQDAINNRSEEDVRDWTVIADWLGIGFSDVPTEAQHEKMADGFLTYLQEGKAPSLELADAFARMRAWLVGLYKNLPVNGVTINDPVRDVMARLLANEEAIKEAAFTGEKVAMITDPKDMTPAEREAYARAQERGRAGARAAMDMVTMRELRRVEGDAIKKDRERILEEVTREFSRNPMYLAREWLQRGRWLDGRDPPFDHQKLSRDRLVETYGKDILKALPTGPNGFWQAEGGLDPEEIAEEFGFRNGDQLVRALQASTNLDDAILKETRARLDEQHGTIEAADKRAERAQAAWENEAVATMLLIEERALSRKAGTQPTSRSIAREAAVRLARQSPVRDLKPGQARQASDRAGRESLEAATRGDNLAAAEAKRREIVQFYLAIESRQLLEREAAIVGRLRNFEKNQNLRKRVGRAGFDYLEKIDDMLRRFSFKPISLRRIDRLSSLAEFIKQREDENEEVIIRPELRNEAFQTHYKNLTMEQLQWLDDAIVHIAHLARKKVEYMLGQERRLIATMAQQMADEADAKISKKFRRRKNTPELEGIDVLINFGMGLVASMDKAEAIAEALAGAEKGVRGADPRSLWNTAIMQPMFAALAKYNKLTRETTNGVDKLMLELLASEARRDMARRQEYAELPDEKGVPFLLNKWDLISVALNLGNASNESKLLGGYSWDKVTVMGVLNRELSPEMWAFVQGAWDAAASLKDEAFALEKRVSGVAPPAVVPVPLETAVGTLTGGYWPVVYDPLRSSLAEAVQIKGVFERRPDGYTRATTGHGHLKGRTDVIRPVKLDASVLTNHLDQVALDIAFREPLMEVQKLLSHPVVNDALMRNLGPRFTFKAFWLPWLQHIAGDTRANVQMEPWNKAFRMIRKNSTIFILGLSHTTLAIQPVGHSNSIGVLRQNLPRNGFNWWLWGFKQAFQGGDWAKMVEQWDKVNLLSAFMLDRANAITRDQRDVLRQSSGLALRSLSREKAEELRAFSMQLIGRWQKLSVDYPTWLAGFRGGIEELGLSEAEAILFADKMVRTSQGGGTLIEQSAVERGGQAGSEFWKSMNLYFSYANQVWQQLRASARGIRFRTVVKDFPAFAANWMLFISIPGLFSWGLFELFYASDLDPEDEDFEQKLAIRLLQALVGESLQTIPKVRDYYPILFGERVRRASAEELFARKIQDLTNVKDGTDLMFDFLNLMALVGGFPASKALRIAEKGVRALQED